MTGFDKMFWGFLFLFDFRIQGFDILPDLIGYFLFMFGLEQVINKSHYFALARKLTLPLILLSIFDLFEVQVPVYRLNFDVPNLLMMLVGIIYLISNVLMVFNITRGIAEMARFQRRYELENKSKQRWLYYLYLQMAVIISLLLALIAPMIFAVLIIPIFILSLIVNILMMFLMKEADRTFI